MSDLERMADGVIVAARDFVTRSLAPVRKQLTELVEMAAALEKRVSAIPPAVKGDPGASAYQIACLGGFRGSEAEWLESLRGKGGASGADGERGIDGAPGKDGVDGKDGRDGEQGPAGERGLQGPPGDRGENGLDGKDGRDGLAGLAGRDGKDGAPGKDGLDGLGFDDLSVDYDGERTFTFKFQCGERRKEFSFKVPLVLERGVFKPDKAYERGDGVTYGGSWYIAQKDAPEGKPGFGGDWRLAVKRGQDGRDGAVVPLKGPEVVRLR